MPTLKQLKVKLQRSIDKKKHKNKENEKQNKKPRSIIGPSQIVVLRSDKYKRNILLMGETHKPYFECDTSVEKLITASKFVQEGIKHMAKRNNNKSNKSVKINKADKNNKDMNYGEESNEIVDVYIESPYLEKDIKSYDFKSHISRNKDKYFVHNFRADFNDCLQTNKKKCKWNNVRVHYTDIRLTYYLLNPNENKSTNKGTNKKEKESKTYGKLHETYDKKVKEDPLLYGLTDIGFQKITNKHLLWLLDVMILHSSVNKTNKVTQIWDRTKIDEQINAVRWSAVRKALRLYFKNNFTVPFMNLKKYMLKNQSNIIKIRSNKKYGVDTNFIGQSLENFTIGLMDTYTLARMMRCFHKAHDPQNIIFYGGGGHVHNYMEFFTSKKYLGSDFIVLKDVANEHLLTHDDLSSYDYSKTTILPGKRCLPLDGFEWETIFPKNTSPKTIKNKRKTNKKEEKVPPCPRDTTKRKSKPKIDRHW